jgi:hypothetical protein
MERIMTEFIYQIHLRIQILTMILLVRRSGSLLVLRIRVNLLRLQWMTHLSSYGLFMLKPSLILLSDKECGRKVGQSPEIFISEDNIINAQESVEVDEGGQAIDDKGMEDAAQDNSEPEVAVKDQQVQERRRSEKLKKDTSLTTMEKFEIAGAM